MQSSAQALTIRILEPGQLPEGFQQQWIDLETRALEPNIYLSPHFLLPALRELTPQTKPLIFAVFSDTGGGVGVGAPSKLVGLAVFEVSGPQRYFPLPHLVAFKSIHSYESGVLIDQDCSEAVLHRLFSYLVKSNGRWHGLRFDDCRLDGTQGQLMLRVAATYAISLNTRYSYERAVLHPAAIDAAAIEASLQRAGGKDLTRRIKRLNEQGEVRFRVLRGEGVTDSTINTFLALEDREWAREAKTSLLAAGHGEFIRQVCDGLRAEARVFIYELLLNEEVIASALNFSAGKKGFAFKIGWNQAYAKVSPGIINELWFLRDAPVHCADFEEIDSGATAGSFIDKVWPDRIRLTSGIFVSSVSGKLVVRMLEAARAVISWGRRTIINRVSSES